MSARDEVAADIDDVLRTKPDETFEEMEPDDFREEFELTFAGIDAEGRVWELDERTGERVRELHRPDR